MPLFLLAALLLANSPALAQASSPTTGTAACGTITPDATDGPIASPENHTVLFENADVRVLDVHSQPHTREAIHTHVRPAVMYIDRQGAGTINTPADPVVGRSHPTDPNFKPRTLAIKPEGPHWTENTGEVPFHAIRVEFKHPGCGLPGWKPALPDPGDALLAAPGVYTLLFENDEVRVLDVQLPPHTKDALHTHPWPGFFYVVQAEPIRHFMPTESEPVLRNFPPGVKILLAAAESHAVENLGGLPLHLIRFELKFGS